MTDYELMGAALAEAEKAAALGEVPVGAVVARHGEIVSAAHNTRETEKNAVHHAELLAIDAACRALGGWRLWECELFVTLEPCPMCAGAILNSRIRRVVYGAADPKAGCCGSVTDLFALPFNHHPAVERGLPFCGSTDMGDLSFLLPVIQPTVSGFTGAAHSREFTIQDEALAYLVPAKLMAATVIDLLAGGAARGRTIAGSAPRRTKEEYNALWRDILEQPDKRE